MAPCPFPYTVKRYRDVLVGPHKTPARQFVGLVSVPCGKCVACRRRKQNEWAFRCMVEARHSASSYFVTLTYDDHYLPLSLSGQPTLVKEHLQKHIKDLRYRLGEIKFFGCGEYGDKFGRPHYHYLLFLKSHLDSDYVEKSVTDCWKFGIIKVDTGVTPANARYCCKYSLKQVGFDYGDSITPFALMSRRPGIGNDFSKEIDFKEFRKRDQWIVHDPQGAPVAMPRRYLEATYTNNERLDHSILMTRVYGKMEDFKIGEFNECTFDSNFYQFSKDIILSREKQFIKQLHKEQYEYKFTPFHKTKYERPRRVLDDFETDEF